ncbi:type I phosphomannose isomerase catalytic subunit [Acidipila sp. EB88]|uniref:type I phosphomannose isomerase catalytic subunit n=1 Tax=Acidipila sp. EB88 TaxID=2305226 RepID=UPI000F60085E|nr:type I phosphomannose isomerase catalytic subunit [Acidipila sp. EB88]
MVLRRPGSYLYAATARDIDASHTAKYGILGCMEQVHPSHQQEQLAPFKLAPYYSTRVWGFEDLAPWFEKKAAPGEPIGEAWLTGPDSIVASGDLAGQKFAAVVKQHAQAILGSAFASEGEYPLLIKVLFPREKLSVQVHPDDVLAQQKGEPRGKTECWYILESEPGAKVALGLKPGVTPDAVRSAIEDKSLEDLLGWVPVEAGDMVYVDAGTVHAIWPGVVILETQQTSDTTYRLYDYGRPRELHVEASIEAMRVETAAGKIAPEAGTQGESVLVDKTYFRVERWPHKTEALYAAVAATQDPQLLFVVEGALQVTGEGFEPFTLNRCELAVIPAHALAWKLGGDAEVMRILPQGGSVERSAQIVA